MVVKNSIGYDSTSLWNVPASWSAWQWVNIIFSIRFGGIPSFLSACDVYGGGSIIIPFLLIHTIKPDVESLASNPCEQPNAVIPKSGASKLKFID